MRCPSCDARNPDDAAWCSQCFATLATPAPTDPTQPDADPTDAAPTGRRRAPAVPSAPPATGQATPTTVGPGDRMRRSEGGIEWRCAVCDTWNPLSLESGTTDVCTACQTPLREIVVQGPATASAPRVSETTALVGTALLPGLGHVLLGRAASGGARMLLYVVWLAGSLALLAGAAGSGQSLLPAAVLLVGAALVWAGSMADTFGLARHTGRELLQPRVLLWIVVGVLGLLVLALTTSAVRLPAGG